MRQKNENTMNIEGKIYQIVLVEKVTGENSKQPGTHYISGMIDVATDASLENIVQVHYTYVTPVYNSGKTNNTYTALKQIMDNPKTVVTDGYDAATVVKLNPSYSVNDFYPQGQDTPVSSPRNEGGFVTVIPETQLHPEGDIGRSKFSFDAILYNVAEVVPDEGESYAKIEGYVFDFRNAIMPVTLTARNKQAIAYFNSLEVSNKNPIFTKVWGKIVSSFKQIEIKQESAFGNATVNTVTRKNREFLITGANPVPYEFDTEVTITAQELEKALQDRQIYLADVKKRTEEYRASQGAVSNNASPATQAASVIQPGGFKF
jgi:hypothetical protein